MIDFDALVMGPCINIFGEPNTPTNDQRPIYTPAGGASFPVNGVFIDAYVNKVLIDDGAPGFVSDNPTLGVRKAEFDARGVIPAIGDQVLIPRLGKTFIVSEPQPDGVAAILLQLNEKAP